MPDFFAQKSLKPAFSWLDVWGEEHAHAFAVAKAVDVELLTVLRDSLKRAIDAGQGFESWRAGLRPELARIGWDRPRLVADPTGERPDRKVDFTAPGRLQTIFSANMRSARAAGEWERIQRTKGSLPYLVYIRTTSLEPRAQHLAWAGTILPADDPWWATHYTPNGWRCKCRVRQMSRIERDEALAQPGYSDDRPAIDARPHLNRRTGEIAMVPDGIDPGWGHNPGLVAERRRVAAEALTGRIEAAAAGPEPGAVRRALRQGVAELTRSEVFEGHHSDAVAKSARRAEARRAIKRAGGDNAAQESAAAAAAPWTNVAQPVAVLPRRIDAIRGEGPGRLPVTVTASDQGIAHSHASHPTQAADWSKVQTLLDRGEIQLSTAEPSKLWAFGAIDGERWLATLKRVAGSWRVLTLFRPNGAAYVDRQRAQPGRGVYRAGGEETDEGE